MASLVLGIVGLFFSIFAAIPAVIVGHKSYSQIRKDPAHLAGEGLALAGLILGYIGIALFPIILIVAIPNLMHSRKAANEAEGAGMVRTLTTTEITYSITYPKAGYAPNLETLGPGGPACASGQGTEKHACLIDGELGCAGGTSGQWCSKGQYKYSIVGVKPQGSTVTTDFIITATPVTSGSTGKNYCAMSDAVVRFREGPPLGKALSSVDECAKWEVL